MLKPVVNVCSEVEMKGEINAGVNVRLSTCKTSLLCEAGRQQVPTRIRQATGVWLEQPASLTTTLEAWQRTRRRLAR